MRTGARGGGAGLSSATGQVDPGPAPPCLLGGFADQSSVFSRPVGPCAPARSSQSAAAALQSDGGRDWPDTLGGCRGRPPGWTQVCSIMCHELRQRSRQLPQCFRQAGCSPGEDATSFHLRHCLRPPSPQVLRKLAAKTFLEGLVGVLTVPSPWSSRPRGGQGACGESLDLKPVKTLCGCQNKTKVPKQNDK